MLLQQTADPAAAFLVEVSQGLAAVAVAVDAPLPLAAERCLTPAQKGLYILDRVAQKQPHLVGHALLLKTLLQMEQQSLWVIVARIIQACQQACRLRPHTGEVTGSRTRLAGLVQVITSAVDRVRKAARHSC